MDTLSPSPMGPLLFKALILLLAIIHPTSSPAQKSPTFEEVHLVIDHLSQLGERAYQSQNWSLWLTTLQINTDFLIVQRDLKPLMLDQSSPLSQMVEQQKAALIQGIRLVGQLKDRLRLIHLYTRLGMLEHLFGQQEVAQGSATLVLEWIETFDQPSLIRVDQAFSVLFHKEPPLANRKEAQDAIRHTLESWTRLGQ